MLIRSNGRVSCSFNCCQSSHRTSFIQQSTDLSSIGQQFVSDQHFGLSVIFTHTLVANALQACRTIVTVAAVGAHDGTLVVPPRLAHPCAASLHPNTVFQSLLTEGKERKQKESKNILCSRVSFKEGKERKIKHVVFPSFI
ncbi:hypothetical protein HanIR_Chr06g0297871 [Helianthus annuus]|nr:hypothetical protein HanIR_Chr06g0297871 [Helianthus annuus]